jgi:hypothetical protein
MRFFCMPKSPTYSEAHSASSWMLKCAILHVVKRLGREAELRINGAIQSLLLYSFMACTGTNMLSYCHCLPDIMVAVPNSQTSRNELLNFKCSSFNVFVLVIRAGFPTDLEHVAIYRKLFLSLTIKPLANINFPFLYTSVTCCCKVWYRIVLLEYITKTET